LLVGLAQAGFADAGLALADYSGDTP